MIINIKFNFPSDWTEKKGRSPGLHLISLKFSLNLIKLWSALTLAEALKPLSHVLVNENENCKMLLMEVHDAK